MTDEALQAAIADATTCAKKMKKVIPLRQIADRASRPGRRKAARFPRQLRPPRFAFPFIDIKS